MSRRTKRIQPLFVLGGALVTIGIAGCHSAFVQATIDNQGPTALRLIEVDYPSASFGVGNLSAHSQFHYRFKIQGSGPLKLEFTDAVGQVHEIDGPVVNQGQEGPLMIVIGPAGEVSWKPEFAVNK